MSPPRSFMEFANVSPRCDETSGFAVEDVSLAIGEGEFVAIVGPSDCGKSTSVKRARDCGDPRAGGVRVDGAPALLAAVGRSALGAKCPWGPPAGCSSAPRSLSYFFASPKAAITFAFVGSVVSQTVAANEGIGYLMMAAGSSMRTPLVFAGLVVISAVAMTICEVYAWLERRFTGWAHRGQEQR